MYIPLCYHISDLRIWELTQDFLAIMVVCTRFILQNSTLLHLQQNRVRSFSRVVATSALSHVLFLPGSFGPCGKIHVVETTHTIVFVGAARLSVQAMTCFTKLLKSSTYHDQGLIPFKTLAFGNGVNYTAGLNKVRTSPDHGTAYEIAGKGVADITSFKEAIFSGITIFKNRKMNQKLRSNPLLKQSKKR